MRIDRFTWKDGDIKLSSCISCVYKHDDKPTCEAFPEGIPAKILTDRHNHTRKIGKEKYTYKSRSKR